MLGFAGIDVCVGGGASDEEAVGDRFGRGDRMGGDMRSGERRGGWTDGMGFSLGGPRPPDARWAELRAGKDGSGAGGNEDFSIENVGTFGAVGVSGGDGGWSVAVIVGFFMKGGGGGGMAFRSTTAFASTTGRS